MNAPTSSAESTALVAVPRQQFDLSPQSFEQALTFSDYLASSELVPKQFRGKPGDCLIAMQWGFEIGLKPLQSLNSIAVINGKPGIYGDVGKAILLNNGCIIEEDDTGIVRQTGRGRCKITRQGRPPVERTFSLEDAKTANLWNKEGPWKTYPYRQMAWRAFWFAARDAAADLLRGLAGAEELMDFAPEKHMGPADVVKPAEPEFYPSADFEKNLPAWRKAIAAKKKTADEVIATVQTKHPLTDEQKAAIRACEAPAADADGVIVMSYAQVAERMAKADNLDKLAEAASLISAVGNEDQRKELGAMYERRCSELNPE